MKTLKDEAIQALPSLPALPLEGLKPIRFGTEACQDFQKAVLKEWVITNGLGGYASSTILGMNTRRYHGLLVAAASPPVKRLVILSKVEETVVVPGGRYDLSTNQYAEMIHPEGYRYLVEFRLDPFPTFFYRIGEILLQKTVFLLPGENAAVIGYTLLDGSRPVELVLRPLLALRDFRWISRENSDLNPRVEQAPGQLTLNPYAGLPPVMIHHTAELFEVSPCWYKSFEYAQEAGGQSAEAPGEVSSNRSQEKILEDLWSPGQFLYLLKVGESCSFVVSTGRRGTTDLVFHERRLQNTQTVTAQTMTSPGEGPLAKRLSWVSESFVARRLPAARLPGGQGQAGLKEGTFLLAGFPWLSSWGRDALVALPGLTLATRRFELARELLETMRSQFDDGLIPVRLAEEDGTPEYDSADASLWFIWAVWHYWKATRDLRFISKKMLDPIREILEAYLEGTGYGIGMQEDGLITLSDEDLPLTWMDGREPGQKPELPGKAVTPRPGKPVEVNALWYCALCIMATFAERLGLKQAPTYRRLSELVQENFLKAFSNPQIGLADRVVPLPLARGRGELEAIQDSSIRPNMLIAAGLPFSPVPVPLAERVLAVVDEHLLTPFGVRTLSPSHPQYRGRYLGNLKAKAQAYHQGTVWAWLIGPYVSTFLRCRRPTRTAQAALRKRLEPFLPHLEEGALGSVSELFDGDAPHTPRGGTSQAWSVGELLRALHEAKLGNL